MAVTQRVHTFFFFFFSFYLYGGGVAVLTTTPDVLPRETATDERCGNSRRGWVGSLG